MTSVEIAFWLIMIATGWLLGYGAALERAKRERRRLENIFDPEDGWKIHPGVTVKPAWPGLIPAFTIMWVGLLTGFRMILFGRQPRPDYAEIAKLEQDPWIRWSEVQIVAKVNAGQNIFEERAKELGNVRLQGYPFP